MIDGPIWGVCRYWLAAGVEHGKVLLCWFSENIIQDVLVSFTNITHLFEYSEHFHFLESAMSQAIFRVSLLIFRNLDPKSLLTANHNRTWD